MILNQLLQRVWNRPAPIILADQRDMTIEPVLDSHVLTLIQRMMGTGAPKIDSAFSVRHAITEAAFTAYVRQQPNRKTLALWYNSAGGWPLGLHLAKAANPLSGTGISFTDQFNKLPDGSLKNGSGWNKGGKRETYLAIYEVHVGNQSGPIQHEFVAHNPAQCTIRYIIKINR